MIKSILITALRTLRRNKLFALINVLGLSVGISAALIIYLMVQYDFSFEQFRPAKERTYRVVTSMNFAGSPIFNSGIPYVVVDATRKEVRGIERSAVIITGGSKAAITNHDSKPTEYNHLSDITYADQHYFDLFPAQWMAGNPSSLNQLFHVALTESLAKKYFPGLTPDEIIGKIVTYDDSIPCTVTGIIKDEQRQTDLVFRQFISLRTVNRSSNAGLIDPNWGSVSSATQFFIRLEKEATAHQITQQLAILRKKYSDDVKDTTNKVAHMLQP